MSKFIVQDPAALEAAFGGGAKPAAPRKGSSVDAFVQENAPLAQKVGERLGVEPHVLLGQWGLETGWGKSVIPGTRNLGNIKGTRGGGVVATDNQNGSVDPYRKYASDDEFAEDFANLLESTYGGVVGAGGDARSYFKALKNGKPRADGSPRMYAEDPAYVSSGTRAAEMARAALGALPAKSSGTDYQFLDPIEPAKPRTIGGVVEDLGQAVSQGVKTLGRNALAAGNTVLGNLSDVELTAEEQRAAAEDDPQAKKELMAEIQRRKEADPDAGLGGAIANVAGAVFGNKEGAAQLAAEQIPNAAVFFGGAAAGAKAGALAGAPLGPVGIAVGGVAGSLIGMFLGGAMIETGSKSIEAAGDGFTQEEAKRTLNEGLVKAGVMTAVDALTFKLGTAIPRVLSSGAIKAGARAEARVLTEAGVDITDGAKIVQALKADPKLKTAAEEAGQAAAKAAVTAAQRTASVGAGLALETVGEGAGEGLGEYAANGSYDPYNIALESLMGLAQSGPQAIMSAGQTPGNNLSTQGILQASADAGGPLSKAALKGMPPGGDAQSAGTPGVDGTPPAGTPGAAQDPITARAAAIETEVRDGQLLEKLREIGQPGRTVTEFLDALAVARNPQADPRTRQQAIDSLDMAMGWIREGKMPGDPTTGSPFSTELSTTPAPRETSTELSTPAATDVAPAGMGEFFDADTFDVNATRVDNMVGGPRAVEGERAALPGPRAIGMDAPADVSKKSPETNTSAEPAQETEESAQVEPVSAPETESQVAAVPALAAGRRPVPLPKVAIPEGAAPAFQRQEAAQIEAAVKRGFDTVERRGDGVYLVNPKTNQESKLSGLGAMARARQIVRRTLDAAASQAASSPLNDLPNPTEAQAKAGNYKKGAAQLNGFEISIENPAGSTRSGTAKDGTKWETTMAGHYGYFKGTEGADGDQVDVFIGPRPDLDTVFVVDQIDPDTGMFDEHKVMMGYPTIEAARAGYLANYDADWKGLQNITQMPLATFRTWVKSREARKPAAMYDQRSEGGTDGQRENAGAAGGELGGGPQASKRSDGRDGADGQGRQAGAREPEDAGAAAGSGRAPAQPGAAAAGRVGRDLAAEGAAIDRLASRLGDPGIRRPNERDPRAKAANSLLDAFAVLTGFRGIAVDWTGEATADGVEMDGELFVNIDQPQQALSWTIGHEFKHVSDRSKAAAALYKRIWDLMPQSARAEYIKYLHRTGQASTADITLATSKDMAKLQDEMVADFMGQRFNDKAWLTKLAKQKPALFGEFVRDWLRILDSIAGYLRGMMGVRGGRGNASKDVDALLAGYVAQLEEAKAIAMEVAAVWATENPRLADRSGISPEGVVYSARDDDMEFPSYDKDFFDQDFQADLQAELDAEMSGANLAIDEDTIDPGEIKAAGLLAEDALGDLYWKDEDGAGRRETARIPNLRGDGKTVAIDIDLDGDSGLWRTDMRGTWVGPAAAEETGFATKQGIKDFVRRQVAATALEASGFDLLSAAPATKVRRATQAWKALSGLDLEEGSVRRYRRAQAKSTTLKQVAADMGVTDAYDISVNIDTIDPSESVYNITLSHKESGKTYGALLSQHNKGGKKFFTVNTLELARSGLGAAVYQMAAEFASRRNAPLRPESSISGVNTYRRTEQMLSAALRTGKSNAMLPHPTQRVYGFDEGAKTTEEHDANIARLLLAGLRGVRELAPEIDELSYDPESGAFFYMDGENAEGLVMEILVRNDARSFGLGRAQMARAAMTNAFLENQLKAEDVTSFKEPVLYSAREQADLEYQAVRDEHLGKSTWMMAPNGRPTKLEERQWIQVRTPSFKKWFGDWEAFATEQGGVWNDEKGVVSKAVEPDTGEPLVVYHGTNAGGFYQFKETGGKKRGDLGIFTTPNYAMARSYVRRGQPKDLTPPTTRQDLEDAGFQFEETDNGTINLIDVDGYVNDEFPSLEEAVAEAARIYSGDASTPGIYAAFVNQRQVSEEDFQGAAWNGDWVGMDKFEVYDGEGEIAYTPTGEQYMSREEAQALAERVGGSFEPASPLPFSTDDVVREARSMNYGGSIIRNVVDDGGGGGNYDFEPSDVHVVFDPADIKSADFNTGEFGDSDDIRFSARNRDPAIGDRTDVARLPLGAPFPESAAAGSLEKPFAMAAGNSYARGRDLKIDLQAAVIRAAQEAGVDLTERTQESYQFLVSMVVADAKYALKSNANAVGWYDSKVSRAIGALAQVHPEIETDPEARLAFLWALAVTSNGLKVAQNFELAERAYRTWRATGTMPDNIGIGNAAKQINKGLRLHKELVDKLGAERLMKFMSTELQVGQIARMLSVKPGGEWMGTPVRGASILGPKIGNGFFSNLNGYFGALTMDRWLMRTWGRMTGTLMQVNPQDINAKQVKLIAAVDELTDAERRAMSILIGRPVRKGMSRAEAEQVAIASQKASMKTDKRARMMANENLNEFRKAGNNLQKALDGQKEAPANPGERNWIRAVFSASLTKLQADGLGMTMSDLQALLWYPERRLYDAAKADEAVEEGYADDEAPDYANAALKLAIDAGRDPIQVMKAMDAAERRGTVKGEPLSPAELETMLKEFRSSPKQQMLMAYEVAPDPANVELTAQWNLLSEKDRREITKSVYQDVMPRVAEMTGIPMRKTVAGTGGFAGFINPNVLSEYKQSDLTLNQAQAMAGLIAYVLDQDSVALLDPRVESENGLVRITFSGKIDNKLGEILGAIRSEVPEVDGFTLRGNNLDFLNFTKSEGNPGISDEELAIRISDALDALDVGDVSYIATFGKSRSQLIEKAEYERRIQGLRPGLGQEISTGADWIRDRARQAVAQGVAAAQARDAAGAGRAATARVGERDDGRGGPAFSAREPGGDRARRNSGGGYSPLEGAPSHAGATGPIQGLVSVAEKYARDNGIDLKRQAEYVQVDPALGARIAAAYTAMEHAPNDPRVQASYDALINETIAQYDSLVAAGYTFTFFDSASDPYRGNPWEAMRDIRDNKAMAVYGTYDGYGNEVTGFEADKNLLVVPTGLRWPDQAGVMRDVTANDLFRAVHDAFGHGLEGAGFRGRGEANAFEAHARLFSPAALMALTNETRAQNSWLNLNPDLLRDVVGDARAAELHPGRWQTISVGQHNQTANVEDTIFADQKNGVLPEWTWSEGRAGDMPDVEAPVRLSARAPGELFFSELANQIDRATMKQAPAAAWKTFIKALSAKGVKPDEIEWTGVNEWLDLQEGKVPKDALLNFVRENGVRVEEVVLGAQALGPLTDRQRLNDIYERAIEASNAAGGAMNPSYIERQPPENRLPEEQALLDAYNAVSENPEESYLRDGEPTKYGQYTLPGGENYREVLLTLPSSRDALIAERAAMEKRGALLQGNPNYAQDRSKYDALQQKIASAKDYQSSHWSQANILAHIRMNDRVDADGKRVLFIEEIQSDFGQDTKKQRDAIAKAVDEDFNGIIERMKQAGVLTVECD